MLKPEPLRPRPGKSRLPPLQYAVPLIACSLLALANAFDYALNLWVAPRSPDFYLTYLAAQIGRSVGWTHIYDPATFMPLVKATSGRWMPYLNTPVAAWIAVPFTYVPWWLAAVIWNGLTFGSLLLTWRLTTAGSRLGRIVLLVAALGLYPIEF